jgi:hypothetical protein
VTKTKQPPTRQRKSIRKSASNVYSHKGVTKPRLPPKKHTKDNFKGYQYDTNSKKKQIPKRVKSNRVVNYMSHKSSAKELHSKPNYNKYNYQSNANEISNKNNGTQSSVNNNSRPMFLPPKLNKEKPPSKYVSHNAYKSKPLPPKANPNPKQEMRRNSSRGKYNSQKSGKMLHYQEYMRKMHENQLRRKRSQKKLVTRGQASRDEQKVYRSRVSSAEVQRDSASRYNKLYGYKPLWYG